jgi:hypothetical protein
VMVCPAAELPPSTETRVRSENAENGCFHG